MLQSLSPASITAKYQAVLSEQVFFQFSSIQIVFLRSWLEARQLFVGFTRYEGNAQVRSSVSAGRDCALSSLVNKLLFLSTRNSDILVSAALCFNESWLNENIPDSDFRCQASSCFKWTRCGVLWEKEECTHLLMATLCSMLHHAD
ncbi:hypothetical protein ATANTOWER_031533 [Ataeniobius toweri]|uniref:Uncharacterized protein n=1 Tax=Ataeniobius toweri TaxID=208326 RepID=A0ABU7B3R4_9TELE|nr:hypothetical protein [Ataeniobius toweri]